MEQDTTKHVSDVIDSEHEGIKKISTSQVSEEELERRRSEKQKEEDKKVRGWLTDSSFPRRLVEASFKQPESENGHPWLSKYETIMPWLGKMGSTWMLCGPRGRGKTQLAVQLAKHLLSEKRKTAFYTRATWLFANLQSTHQPAADQTIEKALNGWCRVKLLVVDEVDKRGESDAEDRWIDNIVCQRHDDGKDTILISNQTKQEALESLPDSVRSRMKQGGVVECDWESFR